MEHEIRREAVDVAFYRLVQTACRYPIKLREIRVENDLFVAQGGIARAAAGDPEFSDDFVIAWSAAEAEKRPEIGRLVKRLRGK